MSNREIIRKLARKVRNLKRGYDITPDERALLAAADTATAVEAPLAFDELRRANTARLPDFPACERWILSDWVTALVGEVGEAANLIKKHNRGELIENVEIAKELADVQTYLDILALKLGINLGEATRAKFNEVSARVDSKVRL